MPAVREKTLPAWPLAMVLVLFMVWWALGVVDLIWVAAGVVMLGCLTQVPRLRVPRGFGVWLVFISFMIASSISVDTANHAVEFTFKAAQYLACTVLFVYIYNARRALNDRHIGALLCIFFGWTVLGGFMGLAAPNERLRTPAYYLLAHLSHRLVDITFITDMVIRRFAQYNPDSFLGTPARPSAPFVFANNWGSVYSLLLPFVVAYMIEVRGTIRFYVLTVLVPVSLIPAFLSLNRGMLIGLLISAVYVAGRLALRARFLPLALLVVGGLAAGAVFNVVAASKLETRSSDQSTGTRAYLYTEAWRLTKASPIFGYGVPVQTTDPNKPPIGTQGQFWMVLVSHGVVATLAFVLFFVIAWRVSRHRSDPMAVAAASVLIAGIVEFFFYGFVPYGLPLMMIAAAVGMRPPDRPPPRPVGTATTTVQPHRPLARPRPVAVAGR